MFKFIFLFAPLVAVIESSMVFASIKFFGQTEIIDDFDYIGLSNTFFTVLAINNMSVKATVLDVNRTRGFLRYAV